MLLQFEPNLLIIAKNWWTFIDGNNWQSPVWHIKSKSIAKRELRNGWKKEEVIFFLKSMEKDFLATTENADGD